MERNLVTTMTALEVARRSSNPDAFTIIEAMSMTNTMLQELPAVMANDGAVHTSVKRLSYPGGEHRTYNRGVKARASQTETQKDFIAILEAFSDVDEQLAAHSGNPQALYKSEALAFNVGMGIDQADDLVYGNNASNPAEINGLATRYAKISDRCIDFGGNYAAENGRLTSVYLIAAGPNACHLIYPKGSASVGVRREDLGVKRIQDPNDGKRTFMAHTDHFIAEYGLAVEHPDAVIRICNIPVKLNPAKRAELMELILEQQMNLTVGIVNTVLFANKNIIYQIERAGREAQQVMFSETDPWGKPVTTINGMRFRRQDAILSTEEQVAA